MKKHLTYLLTLTLFSFLISGCQDDEIVVTSSGGGYSGGGGNPQNGFCFDFIGSIQPYDSLQDAIQLEYADINADDIHGIPLGFNFDYCGVTYDSIFVTSYFENCAFSYQIVSSAFGDITDFTKNALTMNGSLDLSMEWGVYDWASKFYYQTSGAPGNRVTTLEWRDFKVESWSSGDFDVNLLVKIIENGNKIEYHYGPNNVNVFFPNTSDHFAVGLHAEDPLNGLFLSGDPASPIVNSAPMAGIALNTWPVEGTVFVFE